MNVLRFFEPSGDAPRPGRPKTETTPENIDQIHELILVDSRISAKSIAEQLGISRERVGSIILEDLDMRKVFAKWVPKCLNADDNRRLSNFWNYFGAFQIICCRVWRPCTKPGYITMTRRQSNKQWSGGIAAQTAPPQKNSECKNPLEKFSPASIFFWDQDGILLIDYLPKGQTINAEYHSSLLVQLKDILKEKRQPREGHQGGLILARQCPGSPGTFNPEETGLLGLPLS